MQKQETLKKRKEYDPVVKLLNRPVTVYVRVKDKVFKFKGKLKQVLDHYFVLVDKNSKTKIVSREHVMCVREM